VTSTGAARARSRRLAGLLALAGLAAAACVAVPTPIESSPDTVRPSVAPSSSPQSATLAPTSALQPSAWTLAGRGDPASSTQYWSVAPMADGFVVVGSAGQASEVAVALHSSDGTTWTTDQISGRGTSPSQVLAWGDRAIAVGGGETSRCAHPGSEIDTWVRSGDGTWAEAPFAPVLCAGGETTMPVILGGAPWLAGDGTGDVPFLLQSRDGLSWTDRRPRLPDDVFLEGAAVDDTGLWLTGHAVADDSAVALTSADGARLIRIPIRDATGVPLQVVATLTLDGHLIVLATTGQEGGLLRLTPDGTGSWRSAPVSGFPAEEDIPGIQATGGPLVAFTGHEAGLPSIWASADGAAWHQVPVPSETTIGAWPTSIAVRDGTAVLVGQLERPDGNGLIGAIWTAPASILGG